MKHLLVAMFASALVCAPITGVSAPGPGGGPGAGPAKSGGISRGAPARKTNPGRAAPKKRHVDRGARGPGVRPGPGVGAPGPGVRHRPVRRPVVIVRPRPYPGYGYWRDDDDAWKFLAFTAITLKILDNMNEQAQREHEAAQVKATTAPVGEQITWTSGDATGYVVATKEGVSSSGLTCREFQQEVTIGGETEEAWGTACLQEDGSWKITE